MTDARGERDPRLPEPRAWAGVEVALAALGRAAVLLDDQLRVLHVSNAMSFVCGHAGNGIEGRPIAELMGNDLFGPRGAVTEALREGRRSEGHRAFVQCFRGARLVSLSAAPLDARSRAVLGTDATAIVVVRPAEEAADAGLDELGAELGLVGHTPVMRDIVRVIDAIHRSDATVLITGESGVGKEVVAHAIHRRSQRRNGPFVGVNCAALPAGLLESELFGHVRGAFTGADSDRAGRLELAARGTLFLDEIGDMPPPLQAKLLRVLQEREYERLGESAPRPFSARVIAATNVDVDEALDVGQLRKDLYFRLRVVPIHVPPLRERMDDLEPLATALLARIGEKTGRALRLSPQALEVLGAYRWPGNVRELANELEYATAVCPGQTIGVEHLHELGAARVAATVPRADDAEPGEAARIRAALAAHHWRRADAARALNISRTTLWRRMQALGIE